MRVLQLIDSLRPGGAERMAVNLANGLLPEIAASYLCCTRKEGLLKQDLESEVQYLFLEKKSSFDLKALQKLKRWIKNEEIDLVHAHGTSWFWGVLVKLTGSKVKLVWHDHYGNRPQDKGVSNKFLLMFSRYFDGVITVNDDLKIWWENRSLNKNLIKLNNFVLAASEGGISLKEEKNNFNIICIANYREPKGHLNLLKAFSLLTGRIPGLSLILIGRDHYDSYSRKMKEYIADKGLKSKVKLVNGEHRLSSWLFASHLGVLASDSEGLPLALLEYGLAGLPVVCTRVGECEAVTAEKALLVPPGDPEVLAAAIKKYYKDPLRRKADAQALNKRIRKNFSREAVLPELLKFYIKLKRN